MVRALDISYDFVAGWFESFGLTDKSYLKSHYNRFIKTHDWAAVPCEIPLNIMDIGAHWLHNAFFYANDGHNIIGIDVSPVFDYPSVRSAAKAMRAALIKCKDLENPLEIHEIGESSIDVVLFCEVIEHLCFNPVTMWKAIYKVLKPGGRIILTTPNVYYRPSMRQRFHSLLKGYGIGCSVEDILRQSTRGHHWKEYSVDELIRYFCLLSPDFSTQRIETIDLTNQKTEDTVQTITTSFDEMIWRNGNPYGNKIFQEIVLKKKKAGIKLKPDFK
jgi:2-polyprenyl-3-methyl-5-hydroxy-6-metoxy-1,4-benzoquinol methylase